VSFDMKKRLFTTLDVVRTAGVSYEALQHWIRTGKISAPAVQPVNGRAARLWTASQMQKVVLFAATRRKPS
jgi:predicted site-specific integrase-resolvase